MKVKVTTLFGSQEIDGDSLKSILGIEPFVIEAWRNMVAGSEGQIKQAYQNYLGQAKDRMFVAKRYILK